MTLRFCVFETSPAEPDFNLDEATVAVTALGFGFTASLVEAHRCLLGAVTLRGIALFLFIVSLVEALRTLVATGPVIMNKRN